MFLMLPTICIARGLHLLLARRWRHRRVFARLLSCPVSESLNFLSDRDTLDPSASPGHPIPVALCTPCIILG